jgi:hypothetical protein
MALPQSQYTQHDSPRAADHPWPAKPFGCALALGGTGSPDIAAVVGSDVLPPARAKYVLRSLLQPLGLEPVLVDEPAATGPSLYWLGLPDSRVALDAQQLQAAFAQVSGLAEQPSPHDRLGRFQAANSDGFARPTLSQWARSLLDQLNRLADRPAPLPGLSVYLTHDLDRVHPCELMGLLGRARRNAIGSARGNLAAAGELGRWIASSGRFRSTVESIMRIEQSAGATGVYFFMSGPYSFRRYGARTGRRSRHLRSLLHMARRYGHVVGLHGCAYSLERRNYDVQRQRLEGVLGEPIRWHRNHYLVYDGIRSPPLLAGAGLEVDSTVGFTTSNGFRAGLSWPYYLWDQQRDVATQVLEIPLVFMDGTTGRPVQEEWAQLYQRLESALATGGAVAINFHMEHFVPDPEAVGRYKEMIRWLGDRGARLG